jgi:hypothetical protein
MYKKSQTTLYLDMDLVKQAKALGINLSEVAEKAIASMISASPFKDEEVYLDYLIERKRQLIEKELILREQHTDIADRLKNVEKRIEQQVRIVQEIHVSKRIASLIGEVNEVIKSYNYDFTVIQKESENLVKLLNELRPGYFENSWLQDQIKRVKDVYE